MWRWPGGTVAPRHNPTVLAARFQRTRGGSSTLMWFPRAECALRPPLLALAAAAAPLRASFSPRLLLALLRPSSLSCLPASPVAPAGGLPASLQSLYNHEINHMIPMFFCGKISATFSPVFENHWMQCRRDFHMGAVASLRGCFRRQANKPNTAVRWRPPRSINCRLLLLHSFGGDCYGESERGKRRCRRPWPRNPRLTIRG